MAVPEQTPYIEHIGNGVTTSFALEFQCESKDHLIVLVDEIEPPIATWSLTGGNVVFTIAPAAGKKITIQRNTPFGRTTDYQSYNNSFRPPAVNKDFDWIWLKLQELGVADWILGARIDALKNYVDRKDDELKAYLMEEIRKQGVALDQLDEYYNYLMQRLAQIAVDKGWDASFVVDKNGRNQQEINDDNLRLRDYIKYKVGNDWTLAIQKVDDDAIAQNKCVQVAGGTYNYSHDITIQAHWFGSGRHVTRFKKTAPATITILKGGLNQITVSPGALIPNDTSDGVVLDGVDRKDIYDLWTEYHGGHGIDYKRGNLSRFVVHSRLNKGRGVNMAADLLTGDNKAGEIFVEATGNGLSGYYCEQSSNQVHIGSSIYGAIRAQNNGDLDVGDDNYDVVLTGRGHELNVYCEYGKQSVWLRSGLQASRVFFSNMSHARFRNDSNDSNIISYTPSALGTRATINEKFEKITIQNENKSFSGKLSLSHTANNTFGFEATLSSTQQYLELPSNLTLRGASNAYQFAKLNTGGGTLNFGSIPAKSFIERLITISSIDVSSLQTAVIATPAGDIGPNLFWNARLSSFDAVERTAVAVVRVVNTTDSAVSSNELAWRICVLR